MNTLPRTGSYLIDSMLFVLGAICFTLAVGLAVVVGALLIRATIQLTQPYTGSTSTSSLLAILVFALYVAVPSYLLAIRADEPSASDRNSDEEQL